MDNIKLSHSEEWLALEKGYSEKIHSIGLSKENKDKNRYSNILPFDYSRVILSPRENSNNDYINASFIDINEKENVIVTQAPISATIEDFWWMVWTHNVGLVGMFTNFFEGNKVKAMIYWPLNQNQELFLVNKKLCIINRKTTVLLESILTELEIKFENEPSRILYHFHYRGWPDFGTPKTTGDIHQFLKIALETRNNHPELKLLFHCSAGCGRAGVMCAIYRHLITKEEIPHIVEALRKKRMSMVQTDQQYKFIYKIIESF